MVQHHLRTAGAPVIQDGPVRFHDDLGPLLVDIDSVTQHPDNYNNGDVEEIMASIIVNGMYRPLWVQKDSNEILGGNHTWEACKNLGATKVPIIRVESLDDLTPERIMVTDNRIASLARPDPALLTNLLIRIAAADEKLGLTGTGYTTHDLEVIQHLSEIPVENDEFGQWPLISVQVPPHVRRAYMTMTREADTDRDRFELLLRLAGWDGT